MTTPQDTPAGKHHAPTDEIGTATRGDGGELSTHPPPITPSTRPVPTIAKSFRTPTSLTGAQRRKAIS